MMLDCSVHRSRLCMVRSMLPLLKDAANEWCACYLAEKSAAVYVLSSPWHALLQA